MEAQAFLCFQWISDTCTQGNTDFRCLHAHISCPGQLVSMIRASSKNNVCGICVAAISNDACGIWFDVWALIGSDL